MVEILEVKEQKRRRIGRNGHIPQRGSTATNKDQLRPN